MKRKLGLALIVGIVGITLPLATAASAWAQGATLEVSPSVAARDAVVTITGGGYSRSNSNIGGVILRLNTRESPQIATSPVGTDNRISATYLVPENMAPGEYLVIATQTTFRGRYTSGTPGRAKLRIVATASAVPPGRSPFEAPPGVLVAALLALTALMAGTAFSVRRLRTARRAAASDPLFSR